MWKKLLITRGTVKAGMRFPRQRETIIITISSK
jgi:hypothetical protein